MTKILIASVGGSVEPLIKSISEHQPEFICFFCSQPSVDKIGEIKGGLDVALRENLKDHKVIVDDVNDILHCYQKALECTRKAVEWGGTDEDTVVDFTGGTKVMSVALSFASVANNFPFSYVGGNERTKSGLGIVISGSENVTVKTNPWVIFAVNERHLAAELFNQYQFKAAEKVCRSKTENAFLDKDSRQILKIMADFAAAYDLWDKFNHKDACENLAKAIARLEEFTRFPPRPEFEDFLVSARDNLKWLENLKAETEDFSHQTVRLLSDLVANAKRRAKERKYDDAVARMYRALEMVSQIGLGEPPLKIADPGNVAPEQIPEELRDEYIEKHSDGSKISVSLYAGFRLLNSVNHTAGVKFFENENRNRGLLVSRNNSILAHGSKPVSEQQYHRFAEMLDEFHNADESVRFAKFPVI